MSLRTVYTHEASPGQRAVLRNRTGPKITRNKNIYEALSMCQSRLSFSPKRKGLLLTPFYREVCEAEKGKSLPEATQLARGRAWV